MLELAKRALNEESNDLAAGVFAKDNFCLLYTSQCMALPYHLYVISTSGTDMEAQLPLAYGTALVLIMIILLVNLLANALRKYFEKRVKTN